jgi:uncharacterized protein YfaS (alpha-2-macroglobulin family)
MLKTLIFLILSPLLFAQSISSVNSNVELHKPFILKSTKDAFDNSLFYTHEALLSCSPKLSAVYKVESAKKLKVLPRTALQSDSNYLCSYKDESFSFKTVALKVNEALYFKDEKILRLSFNDEIDRKTIPKGIRLKKLERLTATKLKYKIIDQDKHNLVLKILEKVGTSSIVLYIDKNLKTTHASTLTKPYSKTFNSHRNKVTLNSDKKKLEIKDKPQMIALANGKFALRLFLEDNLKGKSKNFINIEGIDNLQVSSHQYMGYYEREKFGVNNSYYYHDITSDEFKANTNYSITLKKGLNLYSRELKNDIKYVLKTPNRAKAILFDKEKHYISSHGELSFSSVNVEDATLVVERILDDNLRYFINFANANKHNVDAYTKEVFTKKLNLNSKINKIVRQKFKLSDLSSKDLTTGIYKVSLHYTASDEGGTREYVSSKVLFISDLGLSIKLSKTQAFVSVLSLSSAKAIKGAEVLVYGKNNALLGTATTNADGIAIIQNKHLLKESPKALVVKTKNDKNFLLLNESISSPMPHEILKKKERFNAHIYFQSNILRPASKLNALITIKDKDFISASKLPIQLILRNPKNDISHKKIYHTDEYGLIDFNYQFSNSDKLGDYHLYVKLGEHVLAKKKLKVEAFMPPKIENKITSNKNLYQVGELIEANISSSYLFGAPSAHLQGKVTLTARPIPYYNKTYKNYSFANSHLKHENVALYLEHSEDIVLDSQGKFEMALSTNITQKVPSILEAMIGVTIMDDSQPVSAYKKVKLYPYQSMVGLKINANSFEKGEKLEGKTILINPLTGKAVNKELRAVIKKVRWHYDYSAGHYNWEKEVTVIDTFNIQANEKFSRTITTNGDYYLEVHEHLSGHSASASFDVWWWSYSNISPNNDLKSVEIHFEDKLYQQGDELEVILKSPILEGKVLLTLEGDKVESYKLVDIHKGTAKISLKIKPAIKRGLYLHASVYRASDTPSNLIPYRAMGDKFVKPNRDAHKIKIEMNLPEISTSKRTLILKLKTSKPAKILLSVVDRGILQLVNQKKPELFKHFNKAQDKALAYYDLYDQLLAYITTGQLVDFGAGDTLNKKKKHLAPDLGKRIKPFMLWSGIVDVKDGVASIELTIPEFNGRAAVVAIAINQDSIGVLSRDIKVKDDIMLKPSYPLFALDGDKIEVPLRVFNTTKVAKEISLSAKTSENLSLLLKEKTLSIPANGSKKILLELYPFSEGKGNISLTANFDNKEVSNSVELPILSPYALSTKTFKGITSSQVDITAPSKYKDAAVYITLSNNLIGALRDDLKYLVRYPHGCAEQTSSKLSAMHYAKPFLNKDKLLKKSKHYILQGIKKLDSMQNYYGEFYYWQGGNYVHSYASLYASQILLELTRDKTEVKKSFEEKIIKMLKSVATKNGRYDGKYTEFHQIYAAFILAEHSKLSNSTANMLYEKGIYKKDSLSTYYMAAILKMQGQKKKANKLYKENDKALSTYVTNNKQYYYGNFGSDVRNMLLHFTIKSKYFNKSAKDLETIQKEFSKLYSTQTKAVALKAVSTYLNKPSSSKIEVDVTVNGQQKHYSKPQLISFDKVKGSAVSINPTKNALAYSVEFSKNIEKSLKNSLGNYELSIKREFIDEAGNEVDLQNFKQGDKFYAKVTIKNYDKIDNVVVSQRIPACFSIVNNNIKELKARYKDENINLEHKEIRDDRVLHFVNLPKSNNGRKGTLYTPLIASSIGECKLPAVITEAMYDTRIHDYAKQSKHVVVKALNTKKPKKIVILPVKKVAFKLRAEALVKELYTLEMSSQKATDFLYFYAYPLKKYFAKTEVSKNKILQDRKKYFQDFKKRTYSNIETHILSSDENQTVVNISFDYKIDNGKKALTGTSKHQLTVIEVNGETCVSEIILNKKKKKTSTKTSKKLMHAPLPERAVSLVQDLYNKEMNSNNENEFIAFFNYPLKSYFRNKEVSQEHILKDKKNYFKSWSKRDYTNMKVTVISQTDEKVKVKVSFNYVISNGDKSLRGKSKHLLTVIEVKGKALVSSVQLNK